MHGRFYDRRQVTASIYDGITKYNQFSSSHESIEDQEKRLANYAKWLEEGHRPDFHDDNQHENGSSQEESDNETEPEIEEGAFYAPGGVKVDLGNIATGLPEHEKERHRELDYFENDDESEE